MCYDYEPELIPCLKYQPLFRKLFTDLGKFVNNKNLSRRNLRWLATKGTGEGFLGRPLSSFPLVTAFTTCEVAADETETKLEQLAKKKKRSIV